MPSADFCATLGGSPPSRHSDHKGHGRQQRRPPEVSLTAFRTPPPNLRRARLMDMDFAASRPLVPRPPPLIRFLCIGACVCSTLPSDPTSRLATPLRFANLHLHQVGRGLSPPSCQTCSAHGNTGSIPPVDLWTTRRCWFQRFTRHDSLHGVSVLITALRISKSLRMVATSATLCSLPLARKWS